MLASVRDEVLDFRRGVAVVLTNLFDALSRNSEEVKRLVGETPSPAVSPVLIEPEQTAQAEELRAELLELRRDVAVVMANVLVAAGRSPEEARRIVTAALAPPKR